MVHDTQLDFHEPANHHVGRYAQRVEVVLAVLALVLAAGAIAWRATGGSFYAVQTASMGTTAPVGSLAIDQPIGHLHVGELISFHPPGSGRIFTHRIVALTPDGGIHTKGDINGAVDGWLLTRSQVLGHVITIVPYAGWLIRAIPILALGLALVWLLTRSFVAPEWRTTTRISGLVAVTVIALTSLHVLVNSAIITFNRDHHGAHAAVVSTGLLPLSVTASGGTSRIITDGQVARVSTQRVGPHNHYQLQIDPDWQPWWIIPLALLAVLPGLLSLTVKEPPERPIEAETLPTPAPHANLQPVRPPRPTPQPPLRAPTVSPAAPPPSRRRPPARRRELALVLGTATVAALTIRSAASRTRVNRV